MAVKILKDTEWNNRRGVVYFILQPRDNLVKIGFTQADPAARFKEHQRDTPDPITWLGCFEGTARNEIALHARFDGQRIGKEWFASSAELTDLIAEKCAWTSGPDAANDHLYDLALHRKIKDAVKGNHSRRTEFCRLIGHGNPDDFTHYLYMRRIPSRTYLAGLEEAYVAFIRIERKAA